MKIHSRKKVLLSSVAMTLVAAVSLGTATFAWFTSSTTATADGITVKTSKTSKLEISDDTAAYGPGFTYAGFASVMFPSSSANGKTWFYTDAAAADAFTASGSTYTPVPSENKNKYVYANQLNIKNAGAVSVNDITISIDNFDTGDEYLRVALVPVDSKTTGGDTEMKDTDFLANIYGQTTIATPNNISYYPVESASVISATAVTPKTATTIDVPELAAGKEAHYNLFVWFEGQDAKCYDAKAGQGVHDLSFTVTGSPVLDTE